MSGYKAFAVVGAGNIGKFIIDELLNFKAAGRISRVIVASRSDASTAEWRAKGAEFAIIDYDSAESLATAFGGVDVVISTIGSAALLKQTELAKAAKAASVQLFIPSEYGNVTINAKSGFSLVKKQIHNQLEEIGLPYSLFFNGNFADFLFIPLLGWDFANGKVTIGGSGDAPISFTHRVDVARFIVHVLTTLPAFRLEWSSFRIEGERLSFNEINAQYEKTTGKKLEVSYIPRSELQDAVARDPNDIAAGLRLSWDEGDGTVGEHTDTALWPEWRPRKVLEGTI